jgi:hypothetical protein
MTDTLRDHDHWIEKYSDETDFERYQREVFIQKNPTGRVEDLKHLGRLIADDLAENRHVSRRQAAWVAKERELNRLHQAMLRAGR